MKTLSFILTTLLFSTFTNPASATLLTADQTSGYVAPQGAFQIHCEVSDDGFLSGSIYLDISTGVWSTKTIFSRYLMDDELDALVDSIESAHEGPFVNSGGMCDIGDLIVMAKNPDQEGIFPIINAPDCQPSITDQNPAAKDVMAWVKKNCNLR